MEQYWQPKVQFLPSRLITADIADIYGVYRLGTMCSTKMAPSTFSQGTHTQLPSFTKNNFLGKGIKLT